MRIHSYLQYVGKKAGMTISNKICAASCIAVFLLTVWLSVPCRATTGNLALSAKATASSEVDADHSARCVNDGIVRISGKGSWVSTSNVTFWGEIDYPWVQLTWDEPVSVSRVVIYGLPGHNSSHTAGGVLHFSDGSSVRVLEIPFGGAPRVVTFSERIVTSVRFEITDGDGAALGLSEIEVYGAPTDYVSAVDPYIETTRGRYFFFVTGSMPFGMISAAPLTRNKNQDGGGYNYNSTEILGFPQIHGWMLSGLDMMPTAGKVIPTEGEQGWKSPFTHDGEIVQPAYHRLYLDRYDMWVEQTCTHRASLYRMTCSNDTDACILLNLGGFVGTTTMTNAHVTRHGNSRLTGYFDTTGRLWGGPDKVRVFFAAEFSRPFGYMSAWHDGNMETDAVSLEASPIFTPRNEGMSYADAPTAGVGCGYVMNAGEPLLLKMAVSYTSVDNACLNLTEIEGWDFDDIRRDSQKEWNDMLGRIDVKGGHTADRIKLYTDLWHTLLGRHRIDDLNGDYPDYTSGGTVRGKYVDSARLTVRNAKGHGMYNSDALWLSQWNLNILWGLAYPEILDDFAASFIQYSVNGGLLPRGPNAGGYSFIMSGCPATSLITSAYQRGLTHRWSPRTALREMKNNHERGGMMAYGQDDDLAFYKTHGYVPDKAGLTIQWSFEDWALAEMAAAMGYRSTADYFHRRAAGWKASFCHDVKMILPRRKDGSWLHTNLLDGWGFEEANSWQATFGLSHDISGLAELMGGQDTLCSRLDYAFRKSVDTDFVTGYGSGYVSYANQPGLSGAHVFAHAGHPELTQYWVRRVRRQAYGGVTPDLGYGGHDEDQGQMGSLSALMSVGLFAIDGCSGRNPSYDITAPIFDEVTIHLNPEYYPGGMFRIVTHNNSEHNCYIKRATLNGIELKKMSVPHEAFAHGGELQLWLTDLP